MRKFLVVIFSFFYLYTAMGVNLNLHYCHGEVDSISFFTEHGSCICDEVFPERMDEMTCCFDKNYKYELDDEQLFTPISLFDFELTEFIKKSFLEIDYKFLTNSDSHLKAYNLPPPEIISDIPIRVLHSVFRL